ncbi:MAG: F0F1 ATP synthase subunit B [Rhodospirillales bacterium]|jgi:F-type H+-transporting ATPase subunit b|nr:F0F1 ATP synthase subunit B [Rhodospirillales bacterium]MBT4006652.1 F0F1 ATP synthase subunit B [Rhodospirillales bacterium]MBT5076219.1 F0F1 ATP synthase subunit B [Rhodospirillales bacterium]MBT5113930.1 F0F1 ATP synthase subunit B [Rhodospirillales bacterium]MBT5672458.1 F0F1 ATP synthase subunit B [Rhodospirillales bacterium]
MFISNAYAATTHAPGELAFYEHPEIWLLVSFVIFIALISKPAWKQISAGLDARSDAIKAELDEARLLREEAQTALANFQRKSRDAAKEAKRILAHAEDEAKRITTEAEVALAETLKRHEALAQDRIEQSQARAIEEVRAEAIEVALAATARILRENLDEQKSDALIDAAVQELPSKFQ